MRQFSLLLIWLFISLLLISPGSSLLRDATTIFLFGPALKSGNDVNGIYPTADNDDNNIGSISTEEFVKDEEKTTSIKKIKKRNKSDSKSQENLQKSSQGLKNESESTIDRNESNGDGDSQATTENTISLADRIQKLEDRGTHMLSLKRYKQAGYCYGAILQLLEGLGGNDISKLRQHSAVWLSECEIRCGNLHEAIARCSEVIESYISVLDDDVKDIDTHNRDIKNYQIMKHAKFSKTQQLQFEKNWINDKILSSKAAMSKALFMRGTTFKLLNKPFLAILDFNSTLNYAELSNEQDKIGTKASEQIKQIEETVEPLSDLEKFYSSIDIYYEELYDVSEECQALFPTNVYSEEQIKQLQSIPLPRKITSATVSKGIGFPSRGMGGLGLDNIMSGLSGLGSLGSMLNDGGKGSGKGSNSLMKVIPSLLVSFAGLDKNTAETLGEIIDAFSKATRLFRKGYLFLRKHENTLICFIALFWLVIPLVFKS